MRWTTCWAILTAGFLLSGCLEYDSGSSGEPCTSDADCPVNEVCESGSCVEKEEPPDCDCETDADCGPGMLCMDCLCQPMCDCMTDADCPAGFYCTELCTCEPVCMCASDADCDDGNAATIDQCIDCHCENMGCACDADQDGWCCCVGEPDGGCDCDDSDPNQHPGSEEICFDWIDNDCDGLVDEGCDCGCLTDDDCPTDSLCWDCQCLPYYHCATTSECPSGWLCHQHGVVCDENHPCQNGTCIPG